MDVDVTTETPVAECSGESASPALVGDAIVEWLRRYLIDLLDLVPDEVSLSKNFDRYGLDSSAAIGMMGDLGNWLGCELDATMPYDHPTISELASVLAADDGVRAAFARSRSLTS